MRSIAIAIAVGVAASPLALGGVVFVGGRRTLPVVLGVL